MNQLQNPIRVDNVGDIAVTITPDALAHRDALIEDGNAYESCEDSFTATSIAQHISALKALKKVCESTRTAVKKPVLDLGREVDKLAREYSEPIDAEIQRLVQHANQYAREQERIRQTEIAEQRRKAEEAQRAAAEARRKAEEAERLRKEQEAREQSVMFPDPTPRDQPDHVAEAMDAGAEAQEQARAAARARSEAAQLEKTKATEDVAGMGTRTKWDFEITDIMALLAHDQALCDIRPRRQLIISRLKDGQEIPGIKAIKTVEASIR